jgi:phage shock protein C
MTDEVKRLYRSRENRLLFGVCGGIGEYFNLDPTLIRVLFVIFALVFGSGLLLYIILMLLIPLKPSDASAVETVPDETKPD